MQYLSPPGDRRLLVRCVELHYRRGYTQKAVAERLRVSAATVSRLLKRALAEGLVRVELQLPRAEELEAALVEHFGLRDAVVAATAGDGNAREALGVPAAALFERVAASGMRVGLSCGLTLYHTVRALVPGRFRGLALYPLSGESTLKQVDVSPNTLVGMMAAKYRPHVAAYALPVQHLVSLRQVERERRRLLRDPAIRAIYEGAQGVDVALVGIGVVADGTPGFCALAEDYGVGVERLRELGVVGEVNYQPFDANGRVVDRPELRVLTNRVLSVGAPALQAASANPSRWVVGVAGGRAKRQAILGALRGRFLNALVTDEATAHALLEA